MKNNPGCFFDIIVLEESSSVSTPPLVTSAVLYPSVPMGLSLQLLKKHPISLIYLLETSIIFPLISINSHSFDESRFGIVSDKIFWI